MTAGFADIAAEYRDARPVYPQALFAALARLTPATRCALDVGAASGQATRGLHRVFSQVVAVDLDTRLLTARLQPNPAGATTPIGRVVAVAEQLPFRAASFDLILAAQAAHWFDPDRFHVEARRLLRPDGIIALLGYASPRIDDDPQLDEYLRWLYAECLAPFWPPERAHVERQYADLAFPFDERDTASALGFTGPVSDSDPRSRPESMCMSARWDAGRLLHYVATASAVRLARARYDVGVGRALERLDRLAQRRRDIAIRWPLFARVGHVGRAEITAERLTCTTSAPTSFVAVSRVDRGALGEVDPS